LGCAAAKLPHTPNSPPQFPDRLLTDRVIRAQPVCSGFPAVKQKDLVVETKSQEDAKLVFEAERSIGCAICDSAGLLSRICCPCPPLTSLECRYRLVVVPDNSA
jgi:hypothetical protein